MLNHYQTLVPLIPLSLPIPEKLNIYLRSLFHFRHRPNTTLMPRSLKATAQLSRHLHPRYTQSFLTTTWGNPELALHLSSKNSISNLPLSSWYLPIPSWCSKSVFFKFWSRDSVLLLYIRLTWGDLLKMQILKISWNRAWEDEPGVCILTSGNHHCCLLHMSSSWPPCGWVGTIDYFGLSYE